MAPRPPPGFVLDSEDSYDIPPPPPGFEIDAGSEFDVPPPPPGFSLDTTADDQGGLSYWLQRPREEREGAILDWLGSAATAVPKKVLSGILDTEAGYSEAAADRKRNKPDEYFQAPEVPLSADPLTMARMGIIPDVSRPEEDRRVAESARAKAKQLFQSVDTNLGLDENGWTKRGLDLTGQMAIPMGASLINPLLGALTFGAQGYGQKYNQLAQLENEDGTPAVSPEDRANASLASGFTNGLASLLPIKIMGGSTGPLASRLAKEYAKQVGVNSVLNPAQVLTDAFIDSNLAGVDRTEGLGDALIQSEKDALLMSVPFALAGSARRGVAPSKIPSVDDFMTRLDDAGVTKDVSPRQQVGLPEEGFAPYISDAEVPVLKARPPVVEDPLANITPDEPPLIEVPDAPNAKSPEDIALAQQIRDEIAVANEDIAARRAAREANDQIRAREEVFLPEDSELYTLRESVDPSMFDNQAMQRQQRSDATRVRPGEPSPYPVKPITNRGTIDKRMAPSEQNIAEHVIETSPKRVFRSETEDILGQADDQMARKAENVNPNRSPFVEDAGLIKLNPEEQAFPKPIIDPTRSEPTQIITDEPAPIAEPPAIIPGDEGYTSVRAQSPEGAPQSAIPQDGTAPANSRPAEQLSLFDKESPPATSRRKVSQRIANRLGVPVTNTESGHMFFVGDLYQGVSKLLKGQKETLPQFEGLSQVNQEYAKLWPETFQWITTTKSRNPQAAPAIEAYQQAPGDMNAMVFDANLALQPVKELPRNSQDTIYNFLAAVRVKSNQRGERYNITEDFAQRFGLSPQEARAAVSVDKLYQEHLNTLQDFASEQIAVERDIQSKRIAAAEKAESEQAVTLEEKLAVTKKYEQARQQLQNEMQAAERGATERFTEMRKGNYLPFGRSGDFYIILKDAEGKTVDRYQFAKRDSSFEKASRELSQYAKENNLTMTRGEIPPPRLSSRDGLEIGDGSVFGSAETQGLHGDILSLLEPSPVGESVTGIQRFLRPSRLPDFVRGANVDLYRQAAEYSMGLAKMVSLGRAKLRLRQELAGELGSVDNRNLARKVTKWASRFHDNDGKAFSALNKAFDIEFIGGTPRPAILDLISAPPMHALTVSKYLPTGAAEWVGAKGYAKTLAFLASKGPGKPLFKKAQPELYNYLSEQVRRGNLSNKAFTQMKRVARGDGKIMKGVGAVHDLYFSLKAGSEHIVDASNHILGWEVYPQYKKGAGRNDARSRAQFAEDFAKEAKAVPAPGDTNAISRNPAVRLVKKYKDYMFKIVDRVFQDKVDLNTGYEISGARRAEMLTKFALASWFMSGAYGVPGVRDAVNIARSLGKEPEGDLREKIGDQDAARLALYGVPTNLTGWDLASGSGWGEIFPEVRQGVVNRLASGLIGAPGEKLTKAIDALDKGEATKAAANIPFEPQLLSNILKGVDMGNRGVMNSDAFAVVPRDQVSAFDIASRMAGLNTLKIKEAQVQRNMEKREVAKTRDNTSINRLIGSPEGYGDFATAEVWRQYAADNGIKINEAEIKRYRDKARGIDSRVPKAAQDRIRRIQDIFGSGLDD